MYRPLAGQLRILWCDKNRGEDISLLIQLYEGLRIKRLRPVNWSDKGAGPIAMIQGPAGTNRIGIMPFEIVKYSNELVVSNFLYDVSFFVSRIMFEVIVDLFFSLNPVIDDLTSRMITSKFSNSTFSLFSLS